MSSLASIQELDVSRLLFDLKRCGELINRFSGWLDSSAIASCTTDGLIEQFDCAFARIWLVDPDRSSLTLVASSGLYTRLDGSFASVPMGSFKVGKIAQNCIPFLSNCLAAETWVKDRDWAIANEIQGFAGLPLMSNGQAIGVLALFSHSTMAPEFLEVLQMLSNAVASVLASALKHEAILSRQGATGTSQTQPNTLSERLAVILGHQKLSLIGTEQSLSSDIAQLFIQTAEYLNDASCQYCRLVYETDAVVLEAMLATSTGSLNLDSIEHSFSSVVTSVEKFGGSFSLQIGEDCMMGKVRLQLPSASVGQPVPIKGGHSPLSKREQDVIRLLAAGLRDREIAEQLYISERTVKFHTKNILTKLGVKTRAQATCEAMRQGWLP